MFYPEQNGRLQIVLTVKAVCDILIDISRKRQHDILTEKLFVTFDGYFVKKKTAENW